MLDSDMKAVIAGQRLCFAATVSADGRPNLSPKGTIRVWDDHHLFFCDIASPQTRRNLEHNPWIELNVVDGLSRRGYRFLGKATLHRDDEVYQRVTARIREEEGVEYLVEAVVLIRLERVLPVISPGYQHIAEESEMRELWKAKRTRLDQEFDEHVAKSSRVRGT